MEILNELIRVCWVALHLIPVLAIVLAQIELRRPWIYGRRRLQVKSERAWAIKMLVVLLVCDLLLLMSTDIFEGML